MANLRTNNLSGEQGQNAYRGSVFFNATPNAGLQMLSSDFAFGVDDFTVEGWFWYSGDGATIASIFDSRTTDTNANGFFVGINASGLFYTYGFPAGTGESTHNSIPPNSGWHHFAIVRSGNDGFTFLNGQQVGSTANMSSTNYTESGGVVGKPSNVFSTALYRWKGYLSNIRVHKKEAIYTSNFTPPTTELKATSSNCVLLCCQDSDDPTQDATGKTITAQNLISDQPKVIPPFGVDAGNTFGGTIQQSTQGYMYFPTGRTEERGRGRGIWGGGWNSPSNTSTKRIDFIQIQSGGIAKDFGDLIAGGNQIRGVSSSTRGVFIGGRRPHPGVVNTMDFVTIATTANAQDFGDLLTGRGAIGEISNQTRGISAAGYTPSNVNTIEFITIATLGNSQDFGDMLNAGSTMAGTQSSTRGILAGNYAPSSPNTSNVIEFLTIASAGNAQDFGDLTDSRHSCSGTSNGVRAVIAGGTHLSPGNNNTMDFVTIASTGNATDFGDLITVSTGQLGATSDSIRGVFGGGSNSPLYHNVIQQVIISTTGNSVDIGDLTLERLQAGCVSDAHGGLE